MSGISIQIPKTIRARIIVAGDSCVGKTAILQVLTAGAANYPASYNFTPGIELSTKSFVVNHQKNDTVEFLLLDSSGYSLYENFVAQCWPQKCLLCLVYDICNKESFDNLSNWIEKLQSHRIEDVGLLIANKSDLSGRRFVTESMGQDLANKHKLQYFECSAKDNSNIHDAFKSLALMYYKSLY